MPSQYSNNDAAWAAAGQMVSTAANVTAQSSINRRTMKYNKEMVEQQRKWALEDWAMQNEYNHPSSQMQRFRDAGLNPNLIYGQTNEGATVRTTDSPSWNPKAPDYSGLGNVISSYQDTRIKEAQLDNLRTQNTVMIQDALLRAAQVTETGFDVKKKSLEYGLAEELRTVSLEYAMDSLSKLRRSIEESGQRAELMSYQTMNLMQQIGERVPGGLNKARLDQINAVISNLEKTGQLKDFEIELNEIGLQKGDHVAFRTIYTFLKKWGIID